MATYILDIPITAVKQDDGNQTTAGPLGAPAVTSGADPRGQPAVLRLRVTATTPANAVAAAVAAIQGAGITGS